MSTDEQIRDQTLAPDVLVVELTSAGTATQAGRPYNQQFVIIARAQDGKLTGGQMADTNDTNDVDQARYISLTTFKRDGTPIATPVWITGAHGSYALTTGAGAWKTKRLLRNPKVEVRVCDARGRVKPDAKVHPGTAEIETASAGIAAAERALAAKYGWQFRASRIVVALRRRRRSAEDQGTVAVHLSIRS